MSFWSWLTGAGAVPNATVGDPDSVGPGYRPGDPNGVELEEPAGPVQARMAAVVPSPWDGWPATWAAPAWGQGGLGSKVDDLVDVAWAALDLNSSVLSAMPVYGTRNGKVLPPRTWMANPDPNIYTDWSEFAKQLFWEFQLGEVFVLPMSWASDGKPYTFRVIPQPLVNVEMAGGRRVYNIGSLDVTGEILHIRYKSSSDSARGIGPLDSGRTRLVAAAMLARYASDFAAGGAVPKFTLNTEQRLTHKDADELLERWLASRIAKFGEPWTPAVMSGGVKALPLQLTPQQMGLLEMAQYSEARIAVLLGTPPFLLGLPTGESMCVDTETEILTENGWRRYDELIIGTRVLTLNHDVGVAEWQPLRDVSVFDVVDRNMVSIEMLGHSSFSTDDHQWPVVDTRSADRVLRLSRDLKLTDALVAAAPCADQPAEPKHLDALVELVAWWFTEGHVGAGETAWLAQSEAVNPEHCARIRSALHSLLGAPSANRNAAPSWSEYSAGNGMRAWRLNRVASEILWSAVEDVDRKLVDRRFLCELTPAQLELFVQVAVWADGCESNGQVTFKQADLDRLERFELACLLSGRSVLRHRRNDGYEVTVRRRAAIRPVVADKRARHDGRPPLIRAFKWTGRVWCPTTPNETWFARRNGTTYFTHNTYSNVSQIFDFHDRRYLKTAATRVMQALSGWALPRGQSVELNRDEYSRPALAERAEAYTKLAALGVLSAAEIRVMERLVDADLPNQALDDGEDLMAAQALTGGGRS